MNFTLDELRILKDALSFALLALEKDTPEWRRTAWLLTRIALKEKLRTAQLDMEKGEVR